MVQVSVARCSLKSHLWALYWFPQPLQMIFPDTARSASARISSFEVRIISHTPNPLDSIIPPSSENGGICNGVASMSSLVVCVSHAQRNLFPFHPSIVEQRQNSSDLTDNFPHDFGRRERPCVGDPPRDADMRGGWGSGPGLPPRVGDCASLTPLWTKSYFSVYFRKSVFALDE